MFRQFIFKFLHQKSHVKIDKTLQSIDQKTDTNLSLKKRLGIHFTPNLFFISHILIFNYLVLT